MRVTITIDCDNDAFRGAPGYEIGRVLTPALMRCEAFADDPAAWPMSLRDTNGNTVGSVNVTDGPLTDCPEHGHTYECPECSRRADA